MRTPLQPSLSIVLAGLLAACGGDPGDSTGTDSTTGTATSDNTTGTTSGEPTSSSGSTTSDSAHTDDSGATTGTSTSEPTGEATQTVTSATSDTGDPSTGSTSEVSASSTGDTGTGGDEGLGLAAQEVMAELMAAVDGVLYLSESDYPWTVVGIADAAPVSEANVKSVIAGVYSPHDPPTLEERAIEVRTLAQLIDPLTTPQDWWGDFEKMQATQYTQIREVLESELVNVQVFRFGELFGQDLMGAIDLYVLGETADGDVVGMWTIAVET